MHCNAGGPSHGVEQATGAGQTAGGVCRSRCVSSGGSCTLVSEGGAMREQTRRLCPRCLWSNVLVPQGLPYNRHVSTSVGSHGAA